MNRKKPVLTAALLIIGFAAAENIDPYNTGAQYGWSENTGWLNAEPGTGGGMHVESDKVTGWVWGENIGWINLHCQNNGTCGAVNFGVVNDGAGNLSGFAWGENVGWINFGPTYGGVTIDADGKMSGWAWGENIGWIHFDGTQTWSVRVCVVTMDDLANFAADWLKVGSVPGNLDYMNDVDMADFDLFAEKWLTYCPDGWPLK
jgi:hypothetical protein